MSLPILSHHVRINNRQYLRYLGTEVKPALRIRNTDDNVLYAASYKEQKQISLVIGLKPFILLHARNWLYHGRTQFASRNSVRIFKVSSTVKTRATLINERNVVSGVNDQYLMHGLRNSLHYFYKLLDKTNIGRII